jgi:hypothetical protein
MQITQTMNIKSIYTTALLCFPLKLYTLARFEPWSSVYEADEMSTATLNKDAHSYFEQFDTFQKCVWYVFQLSRKFPNFAKK